MGFVSDHTLDHVDIQTHRRRQEPDLAKLHDQDAEPDHIEAEVLKIGRNKGSVISIRPMLSRNMPNRR